MIGTAHTGYAKLPLLRDKGDQNFTIPGPALSTK